MPQSAYSWCGTRLHLVLEDDLAEAYNRAHNAFVKAQEFHKQLYGTQWTGKEALLMSWTEEESDAWSKIARIINLLVEVNGGALDIPEEEMASDYLLKL